MDVVGPLLWKIMHLRAHSFSETPTEKEKTECRNFYANISFAIECDSCKEHYLVMFYTEVPFDNRSGSKLRNWVVDIHNRVNVRLGKRVVSYEESDRMYREQINLFVCPENNFIVHAATTPEKKVSWGEGSRESTPKSNLAGNPETTKGDFVFGGVGNKERKLDERKESAFLSVVIQPILVFIVCLFVVSAGIVLILKRNEKDIRFSTERKTCFARCWLEKQRPDKNLAI
jgi:hypothetical protein